MVPVLAAALASRAGAPGKSCCIIQRQTARWEPPQERASVCFGLNAPPLKEPELIYQVS